MPGDGGDRGWSEGANGSGTSKARDDLYLGDSIEFFLNSKRSGGRSEKTISDYMKKLETFQCWASEYLGGDADIRVSAIDAGMIERYMVYLQRERMMADSSRKNHLAVLTSFFRTISKRLKVSDPSLELDDVRFHSPAPKRSFLTKREAEILLSSPDTSVALGARDHAMLSVMLYAGLRIEEVTDLDLGDLGMHDEEEEVRVSKGKGNKERRVPMGPKLRKSIERYLGSRDVLVDASRPVSDRLFLNNRGNGLTENTVRRTLYKYVRQSGIRKTDIHPHDLRRTFATWFLQDNPGHHRELAQIMGHSDLSQVMKYALSDEKRAREGVSRL